MMLDLLQIFILNVMVNSVFSFVVITGFFGLISSLFRLHTGRILYILKLFPIFKLPLDLFLYQPSSWALFNGMNPLEAVANSRTLTVGFEFLGDAFPYLGTNAQMTLSNGYTFTPADVFALWIGKEPLFILIGIFVAVSIVVWAMRGRGFYDQWKQLRKTIQTATPCLRPIQNTNLQKFLEIILSHPNVRQPFAFGVFRKRIVLPKKFIESASQDVFEATIAHELEHLRWNDPFIKMVLHFICAIFWWVPAKFWLKKIEQSQEIECDCSVERYNIEKHEMASAIFHAAKYKFVCNQIACSIIQTHSLLDRVEALLAVRQKRSVFFAFPQYCLAFLFAGILFFAKFWIF